MAIAKSMFFWEPQVLEFMGRGDYDHALVFLRKLKEQSKNDLELRCILLNEAECLRESGDFKRALRLFKQLNEIRDASAYDKCVYLLCEAKCLEALDKVKEARGRLGEI